MSKVRPAAPFLSPLTGPVRRKNFAVFDIESKHEDTQQAGFTRPFLVGFYDPQSLSYDEYRDEEHLRVRDWHRRHISPGGCIDKLLTRLLTKKYKGYVFYAHNGGNFDHLFLLAWLREHMDEFGFEVVPVQSSIQVIRVWRLPERPEDPIKERWEFHDSMKLMPMGLEKAAKSFGLEGKQDHDLDLPEDDPSWSVYLKRDCVLLAEILGRFYDMVENKLGGEVGMTAPSTSMKLFRRRFLGRGGSPDRVPRYAHWPECDQPPDCFGCAHEWIRQGYYGGRTELFRTYGEKLHYYDINSSYVAAMREGMPAGDREIVGKLDWRMHKHHAGFVECAVKIPANCKIPPLPHRDKLTGKLMFPAGRFRGVWSCEELALLDDPLVKGEIEEVRKVVWFKKKPLFVDMVDELWQLRDKSRADFDQGLSELAKLMGNSLYGKFGMRQERTSVVFTKDVPPGSCFLCGDEVRSPEYQICDDCVGSKPAMGDPDCDVWYQKKRVEADYIIPQIAAHITSLARVRIWRYMKEALLAGGDIWYCDTDSVLTDAVLSSSMALGGLKDEFPGQELTGTFVQPKVYMLEGEKFEEPKVTMKGFPLRDTSDRSQDPKGRKIRTKENLERLSRGETLEWKQLEKVRTLAREGFHRPPQMKKVKKSFQGEYDKRQLHSDGTTTPNILDENEWWDHASSQAAE